MRFQSKFLASLLAVLLVSCASIPDGNGEAAVRDLVNSRGRPAAKADADAAGSLLRALSGRPMDVADAVQLGLANSPRITSLYAELGIASSEVYEAGRLSNPRFSASVLFPNAAGESAQVSLGLAQSFTDLLLLSRRSRLAEQEFTLVQQEIAAQVLELASDIETAYYEVAGAQQLVTLREAIAKAAATSATLAQRFFDAGNISRLELTREQAVAARAAMASLEAQADAQDARTELNELLGLSANEQRWTVAPRLAVPLAAEDMLPDLIRLADSRLDLRAARARVQGAGGQLGLTRSFRYLGDVELGVETERETDGARLAGPTLEIELPLFNSGAGKLARAKAELQLAEAELRALEIETSNEVHKAHRAVTLARQRIDLFRTTVIPLQESVVARVQEQVNFMLAGQFELLSAKREELEAYEGYLEAVETYWLARASLARAVGGDLPSGKAAPAAYVDAIELTAPKPAPAMDHHAPGSDAPEHTDHGGQGNQPVAKEHQNHAPAPKKQDEPKPVLQKAPSQKKPPRPASTPGSDMPTGMESHNPPPANETRDPPAHDHGDH